jgi:hypothetical protein
VLQLYLQALVASSIDNETKSTPGNVNNQLLLPNLSNSKFHVSVSYLPRLKPIDSVLERLEWPVLARQSECSM